MNPRRFIAIAAIVTAGLAFVAWRLAQAKHAAAAERHALAETRAQLAARLRRSEQELDEARKQNARRESSPAAPAAPPPAAAAGSEPRAANTLLEWLEDPKVQVLHFAQERANLPQAYGPFFRAQNLTPAQIERLCDLIVQSRINSHDLSEIHRLQGKSFNDPAMLAQRDRDKAEVEAGMRAVLGEAGLAQFNDYRRSLEIRRHVSRMAGFAAVDGLPISREQADTLVGILAAATPLHGLGGNAEFGRIDWKSAETQARAVLSPAQMKFLRDDAPGLGAARRDTALWDAISRARREIGERDWPGGRQ